MPILGGSSYPKGLTLSFYNKIKAICFTPQKKEKKRKKKECVHKSLNKQTDTEKLNIQHISVKRNNLRIPYTLKVQTWIAKY